MDKKGQTVRHWRTAVWVRKTIVGRIGNRKRGEVRLKKGDVREMLRKKIIEKSVYIQVTNDG